MDRLNLTLDADTSARLELHAKRNKQPRASLARELLREALLERDARERRHRLARDYAAGSAEAMALLAEMEAGQLAQLDEP